HPRRRHGHQRHAAALLPAQPAVRRRRQQRRRQRPRPLRLRGLLQRPRRLRAADALESHSASLSPVHEVQAETDRPDIEVLLMWSAPAMAALSDSRGMGAALQMRRLSIPLFIVAGIACGLAAVAFHSLVELMRRLLIDPAQRHPALVIAVPALVLTLIALVIRRFAAPAGGANLARVRRAYGEDVALLDDRSIAATLLLTPISLGAGAPLAPEGPTVVVASGISMWIARAARLPRKLIRSMIPVGTAAGIAAIFNTPITGVVFALEEVMGNAGRGLLGGTIVAAVAAAVVERLMLGGRPLLSAPSGNWTNIRELLGFAAAGVVAGAVSGGAVHAVTFLRRRLARVPAWLRGAGGRVAHRP